jgi:hypothetical protein
VSIDIALVDAATNCARDNATAVITLRSGARFEGTLARASASDTAHLKTDVGGWVTIDKKEIAAVEARPLQSSKRGLYR